MYPFLCSMLSGILFSGGLAGNALPAPVDDAVNAARSHREAHAAAILTEFRELLAIPNVGSDLPNIHRNAEFIRAQFQQRGVSLESLTLDEFPAAPPLIVGRIDVPNATRTLGIYVHYDGQPADPTQWTNPPWMPVLYNRSIESGGEQIEFPEIGDPIDPEWRLYARASGDDKVPLIAILAALDALQANNLSITSNLVFLFDGEEEMGSPHLERYLDTYLDHFDDIDIWLFCDGPVHQSRRPQLVFGVRGIVGVEITVYGASRYLHSGHYGNWAPNPGMMLSQLLASMKHEDGKVLIDGFYDTVAPLTAADRAAVDAVPPIDADLRRELGIAESELNNAPLAERILLPSLNIRGLQSATVGETARNVIPTSATASIDIRLVKGNDPQHMVRLLEDHVRRQGYTIIRDMPDHDIRLQHARIAKITSEGGYPAARTEIDHPLAMELTNAARRAAGDDLILMPALGGSLPLYLFTDGLATPAIIVPIANHDNNQHAPDGNIRLANLWYGIDLMAAVMTME